MTSENPIPRSVSVPLRQEAGSDRLHFMHLKHTTVAHLIPEYTAQRAARNIANFGIEAGVGENPAEEAGIVGGTAGSEVELINEE